ncbi:MAG: DUF6229 family protein [Jatrophihabitans sp.]
MNRPSLGLTVDAAAEWRSNSAADDSPAGPLFSSRYAEADLSTHDPFVNCSLNTGSHTINCCA